MIMNKDNASNKVRERKKKVTGTLKVPVTKLFIYYQTLKPGEVRAMFLIISKSTGP